MAKIGRPTIPYPRRHSLCVRLSDTEWGAVVRALAVEHPVVRRRPTVAAWLRDLVVAHATEILRVQVSRSGLRHLRAGAPDWHRWRLARAVQRAARRRRGRP